jgi:hypothetical protein
LNENDVVLDFLADLSATTEDSGWLTLGGTVTGIDTYRQNSGEVTPITAMRMITNGCNCPRAYFLANTPPDDYEI